MADASEILERVRSLGANIVLDEKGLRVVNKSKLPENALSYIAQHRADILSLLKADTTAAFEERAAIIEYDAGGPREWAEQFARILTDRRPSGINDLDWSYFITTCGRIIDETPQRSAA